MALKFAVNNSLSAITTLPSSISGGALNLISTQTASASASLEFSIDGTYDSYVFKFININPATNVWRYCNGQRIPHPIIMKKIYYATNQQVTPQDFYEQYWEKNNI